MIAEGDDNSIQMERDLNTFLSLVRIKATISVVEIHGSDIAQSTVTRYTELTADADAYAAATSGSRSQASADPAVSEDGTNPFTSAEAASARISDTPAEPSEMGLRRLHTSIRLNAILRENSAASELVLLNLPNIAGQAVGASPQTVFEYMENIEILTAGIGRLMLIRGGGDELISIY